MNILVIGGGGREHAIIWKLSQNSRIKKMYCAPGNAGTAQLAENVSIPATDIDKLLEFAMSAQIDLTVVGMEDPLVLGIVDLFQKNGLRIFGPSKAAAMLEGSKAFSKNFMKKYNIPTAEYAAFSNLDEALVYVSKCKYPLVIKTDGLAAGKGVFICQSIDEAKNAVLQMMDDKIFAQSGNTIIVEEFLVGKEVSVLAFCDGKTIVPMQSARDHKRAHDNDCGLNTGGMGTVSPCEYYTLEMHNECMETIFKPTVDAMQKEGAPFKGIIFFGLMLTDKGAIVLEYNARFGDPETQVVLPRLENDLLEIFEACIDGTLENLPPLKWTDNVAVCVIMASGGYPLSYKTGYAISFSDALSNNATIFHAGTKNVDGVCVTNGGRVLGVTGLGKATNEAAKTAYENVAMIDFTDKHYRNDIGRI